MAPPASKFVTIEGMRTHYLEAGGGFPLVLLHSGEFGASAELSWEFNIAPLSRHFRVLAPDWLGFGQSAKIFSFDDMRALRIRHIAGFLNALGVRLAHFMGNSMGGGLLAEVAAMKAPVWPIDRMILASAGGFAPANAAREILNSYDGTRTHMERILKTVLTLSPLRDDAAYLDRRHAMSLEPGAWECTAAARFRRPGTAVRDKQVIEYREIKCPTLIIAGAKDPLRLPGYADEMQKEIAGSEKLVLSEAGHFPQIDAPDEFNRAVIEFLLR